jgi:hypothetical protein
MNHLAISGAADGAKRTFALKQDGLSTLKCHFTGDSESDNTSTHHNTINLLHPSPPIFVLSIYLLADLFISIYDYLMTLNIPKS